MCVCMRVHNVCLYFFVCTVYSYLFARVVTCVRALTTPHHTHLLTSLHTPHWRIYIFCVVNFCVYIWLRVAGIYIFLCAFVCVPGCGVYILCVCACVVVYFCAWVSVCIYIYVRAVFPPFPLPFPRLPYLHICVCGYLCLCVHACARHMYVYIWKYLCVGV